MLATPIVVEIQRLLNETDLSQRKIAEVMGVSRGSVASVASGKRPDYDALRAQSTTDWEEPAGPPERCPTCGGMVYAPCRLCRARVERAKTLRRSVLHGMDGDRGELSLQLHPEHHARYEPIHARRRDNPEFAEGVAAR
ncbi:MAG: hypothetical protein ABFC77_03525 [Thermoguttaceae bacterium]